MKRGLGVGDRSETHFTGEGAKDSAKSVRSISLLNKSYTRGLGKYEDDLREPTKERRVRL